MDKRSRTLHNALMTKGEQFIDNAWTLHAHGMEPDVKIERRDHLIQKPAKIVGRVLGMDTRTITLGWRPSFNDTEIQLTIPLTHINDGEITGYYK